MKNKNEARNAMLKKFNVSSHVYNHSDEQFKEAFLSLKKLDAKKFKSNVEVSLALEKTHSTLTHDTLQDVFCMLKNAQNEKYLKTLKIDCAFCKKFNDTIRMNKFASMK